MLGSPLGHLEFVKPFLLALFSKHGKLIDIVQKIGDVQCAWILLVYCIHSRANYYLRTVAPDQSSDFALAHDEKLWKCLGGILNIDIHSIVEHWKILGSLPLSKGGLSLRSAFASRKAAHWASWADCLEMIQKRHPDIAASVLEGLHQNDGAVSACKRDLETLGCVLPSWAECCDGVKPKRDDSNLEDFGSFKYGWQHHVVSTVDVVRKEIIWSSFSRDDQAHVRSQSGPGTQSTFTALPTSNLTRITPSRMRVLLLRRLRFNLPLVQRCCRCHHFLDPKGDHRCACATSGFLSIRGYELEVVMARVCREGGARVQSIKFLRDLNVDGIAPTDGRRIEIIANGLGLFHGAQLAIDTTIVSALRRNGMARPRAAKEDGVVLEKARKKKETTYPELTGEYGRARLVVFAIEVGGRWSPETIRFIHLLAEDRAKQRPEKLRKQAAAAWKRRWVNMISVGTQRAIANSLLERRRVSGAEGVMPSTQDVLPDVRYG